MSNSIIQVSNLGKSYMISHEGKERYTALRDVMARKAKKIFSFPKWKPSAVASKEEFWALKDINFNVERGDRVGIIGRNGAGKSTLLKILSRITEPTSGAIKIKGRVASLLEVGTGFHPELTGRENIFLNGAILGMSRAEIKKHFDAIVDFAEIEKFLDTPVKRYSSGMYVRLAFAVAAHLEPEILVVDEVLAVGDVEFQKKCLGKLEDVSAKDGRTVLFVSHNMAALSSLCTTGIYLKNGRLELMKHDINAVVAEYLTGGNQSHLETWKGDAGDQNVRIYETKVYSGDDMGIFHTNTDVYIEISGEFLKPVTGAIIGFTLWSQFDHELAYMLYDDQLPPPAPQIEPGKFRKRFKIPGGMLAEGTYKIQFDIGIHMLKRIINNECDITFTLANSGGNGKRFIVPEGIKGRAGIFRPNWIDINE
ncbi:MAG: ABC transporter ATP-binding protein [Ferruginibacter sp.]